MLKTHRDKMTNIMKSINAKKKKSLSKQIEDFKKTSKTTYLLVNALNLKNVAALANDGYQLWSSSFYSTKEAKGKWQ